MQKKRKPTQKYFNFVPMLESRNVHHVKSNCSWDIFCEKIQADITVSWVFQKYLNFYPCQNHEMWITWNVIVRTSQFHQFFIIILTFFPCYHHGVWITWKVIVRETCFCEKNSGGHHSFLKFSKLFKLSPHTTIVIKKCKSIER